MIDPVPILVPQDIVNDTSVRVVRLAFKTGQQVKAGQPVVELETSKTNIEVEAPASGWLKLLCIAGDDLPVGGIFGLLFHSKEALDAALLPAPAAAHSQPLAENAAGVPVVTVFSDQARALVRASGLDEAVFAGRSFVRAAEVRALLADEAVPLAREAPASNASAANLPLQQTFADGWSLRALILSDLHRIDGRHDFAELMRQWFWNPSFSYVLWFRIAQWARLRAWAKVLVYPVAILMLHRRHLQSGIRIPISVKVGPGLLIGHWGSVWINHACTLGANCTLSNDINLGSAGGAGRRGVPQLGDDVFLGPGCRIAGPVKIGTNVAIMANTLVTADVPPGSIVIGVPHRISGHHEKNIFASNTDYPVP